MPKSTSLCSRHSHLKRHIDNVHRKIRFPCPACPKTFFSSEAVLKHRKQLHDDEQTAYTCDVCKLAFKKKSHMTKHRAAAHGSDPTPHKCPVCRKGFRFPNKLKIHMRVHEGYECPDDGCEQKFDTWSEVRKHVSREHKKPHKCGVCKVAFVTPAALKEHEQRHAEKREAFVCTVDGCDR